MYNSVVSVFRKMRIIAVAVLAAYCAVSVVNNKLWLLILCNFSGFVNCIILCWLKCRVSAAVFFLNCPTLCFAYFVIYYMLIFWFFNVVNLIFSEIIFKFLYYHSFNLSSETAAFQLFIFIVKFMLPVLFKRLSPYWLMCCIFIHFQTDKSITEIRLLWELTD